MGERDSDPVEDVFPSFRFQMADLVRRAFPVPVRFRAVSKGVEAVSADGRAVRVTIGLRGYHVLLRAPAGPCEYVFASLDEMRQFINREFGGSERWRR